MSLKSIAPYAVILCLGGGLAGFLFYKRQADIEQIREGYIAEKSFDTQAVAVRVEDAFKAFYQGLRTMTLLPGVRTIDRYGKTFQPDSKKAMQQIYNNTYLNVTLSEVYLLPKSLDPDKIDPTTGKPEEPILTFDEFIVGGAAKSEEDQEEGPELEEVEIFEYRLMNRQLTYLRQKFPSQATFDGLNVPAVMGEPVITCDNSEFSKSDLDSGNDKPRMGILYTLPVYAESGEMHGAVSGIVRINVLERLMPKGNFALVSKGNAYLGITEPSEAFTLSKDGFARGQTNPGLVYSQIRKLNVVDAVGWELWAVAPNEEFTSLPSVRQANLIFSAGLVVTLVLVVGLGLAVRASQRSQMRLEHLVKEKTKELVVRNNDMRLILDNAAEGFLTCSLDGRIGPEYSAIVENWFGKPGVDARIWEYLLVGDSKRRDQFRGGWDQMVEDFLPFEVSAGQIPAVIQNGKSFFGLSFTAIRNKDKLSSVLVVVTDVTAKVEAERRDREQQELVATFQALSKDRAGFLEFFSDAENLIKALGDVGGAVTKDDQFRIIHTLKGNCAQYGLATFASVCHDLESKLQEGTDPLPPSDVRVITNAWAETSVRLISLIGNRARKNIELDVAEYTHVLQRIRSGASTSEIAGYIERWRLEPAVKRLDRMAEQAKSLADRLNIGSIAVMTNDSGIRLEPEAFSDVWSSMIHVVRNAVDHGFGGGGVSQPILHLETAMIDGEMEISVRDNGVGIDWERVREKAQRIGLPCSSQADLESCLFADGLSTKDEVSSISGRGVGMSAVKAAVAAHGGRIVVLSTKGKGTEFRFTLPMAAQQPNRKWSGKAA